MKSYQFLAPLALVLLLSACGSDSQPANTAAAPAVSTEDPKIKPEVYLFATTVDKLNLREAPNKNGNVITQLAEGDFVESTGEVSVNKEEAQLRGITYLEPYFKVTSTTPEQHNGWAYGGALQRVYAGSRANSPDLGKLSQFTMFLKTLDAKKLESGKKAWDYVKSNLGSANGSLADATFILLDQYLFRMEREGEFYTLTEKIAWTDQDYMDIHDNKFDMNRYPATKPLAENGFRLATGEGMVFPVVDWNQLSAFFSGKVTGPMAVYIKEETTESNETMYNDGGIIVPLQEIADRAAAWEKFNKDNPYFARKEETVESERWMRLIMVNGSDNTPTFDYESQMIRDDFKNVWAYIAQKYPGTQLATVTKELSDLCAAEGWKRTKKVEDWQVKFAESQYVQ
ncbi:MAG TPA: SH3 domain-containing protein [Saprospiraceae bacterium]|nr:SH3 domain-containing protein [Saprospiraceae bacterium]